MKGLDPTLKSARLANYIVALRKDLHRLSHACGEQHPAFLSPSHVEILDGQYGSRSVQELFGYHDGFGLPSPRDLEQLLEWDSAGVV